MKVAVLLSGGVDSSVALNLLLKQGYTDLTAYYLKIWLEDELSFLGECPWEEDLQYARAVCKQAGVPLKVISLQKEYHDRVVSYTISELKKGRTPSPDIFCNQRVKFGAFFDKIEQSYDKVASGHYAQILEGRNQTFSLLQGVDPIKDQSYFLSHLSQQQLSKILFPLGHLQKKQVRELAEEFDLPTKNRKDSQGICFLGKIKYNDFVKCHLGVKPGKIVDIDTKKVIGDHQGYWFHTVGQRKGLGLGGGPWFVVGKDVTKNIIFVCHLNKYEEKRKDQFLIEDLSLNSNIDFLDRPLTIKIRHTPEKLPCIIDRLKDNRIVVRLEKEDKGIASGQFAVIYDNKTCLGAGKIV